MGDTYACTFSRAQARAYDRRCMEDLGIPGIELMRNASRGCAEIARGMAAADDTVIVVCGSGQNGGDGYGVAALLARDGRRVRVLALGEPRSGTDAAAMRDEVVALGIAIEPMRRDARAEDAALVVDALFGTGLDRPLSGDALDAVRWINAQRVPVLSIDLPSGMDCDTGIGLPECVRADVTATMVAPKQGFAMSAGRAGRVVVVPIGGPDPGRGAGG